MSFLSFCSSDLRPYDAVPYVVPAEAEVVAEIRICAEPQQFALDAWAGEAALRVLVIAIGEIPEQIIAVHVNKTDELIAHPFISTC